MVTYRHRWGEHRVFFYDAAGQLRSIPALWTSLVAPDPVVVLAAGRSLFRVSDLLAVARLLQRLTDPPPAQTIPWDQRASGDKEIMP